MSQEPDLAIKTHQQGSLDGLCGVYSVHNSLRQLLGARTDEAFDQRLFRAVLRALPRSAYPEVLWRGIDVDQLFRVSRRACDYLREKHGIEIKAERPFARRRFSSVRAYLDALDEIASTEFTSFIVRLDWLREGGAHWSVYRGRESGKLRLYDSGRMHSLNVQSLTLGDTRANQLSPQETVMFRLVSVDGEAFD
jgi:hypothetical protein